MPRIHLKRNLSATDDFSVPHLAFTDKFKIAAKKGLYLSINVFSMKELFEFTVFTSAAGDGTRHFTWSAEPCEGLAVYSKAAPSFSVILRP